MRVAPLLLSVLALAPTGDWATASLSGGTLRLTLHYLMTCGEPGPGPLELRLPARLRLAAPRVVVGGRPEPMIVRGSTLTVQLPPPSGITCMSIAEGALPVVVRGVSAPRGGYSIAARIRNHAFTARLRVP